MSTSPPTGEEQARRGGELLVEHGILPAVVHTSLLRRAIRTAEIALHTADRHWLPVKRSWRLNERHYGALQGKDKAAVRAEFGDEQFMLWRRSYDVPPPPLAADDEFSQVGDPRYADLLDSVPRTECLADVVTADDAVLLRLDRARSAQRHRADRGPRQLPPGPDQAPGRALGRGRRVAERADRHSAALRAPCVEDDDSS